MAKFNPDVQVSTENNFINASQGQTANKSLGLLFSGLADTLEVGMQDKMNRDTLALDRQAREGVDAFNNEVIGDVSDPSLFTSTGTQAPKTGTAAREPEADPPGITQAAGTINRLRQARAQGKLSEPYFMQRVTALSKSLHAQYPHLSDKIDDVVAGAIGSSTANQMRKQIDSLLEQESASASTEEKRKRSLLSQSSEFLADPYVMSTYEKVAKRPFNPDDFDESAFLYARGVREFEDKQVARAKARTEAARGDIELQSKLAKKSAVQEATILRDRLLFTTLAPEGLYTRMQFGSLSQLIEESGGKPNPEQAAAIGQIMGKLKIELKLRADQLLAGTDQEGNSYSQYITEQSDRNDVTNIFMAPLNTIEEALTNSQLGILGAIKRDTEARQAYSDNQLLQKYGGITSVLDQAKKMFGSEAVEKAYRQINEDSSLKQVDDPEQKAVGEKLLGMLLTGESPTEILKQSAKDGSLSSGTTANAALNVYLSTLNSPDVSKEQKVAAADRLFSESERGLLESFTRSNPEELWNSIMNPVLLEDIKGTDAYSKAYTWGIYQSKVLLKPLADQIYDTQAYSDVAGIQYNPATKRFDFRNEGPSLGATLLGPYEAFVYKKGNDATSRMNRLLDRMQPVIEGNGDSLEAFLGAVFTGRDFKSIQKEGSVITRMRDSFFKNMKNPPVGKGGGDTEPPPLNPNPPRPDLGAVDDRTRNLLSFISSAEGADYQTMFGGKRVDLENMTIEQVLKFNRRHGKRTGSSATGAFQVMHATLKDMVKAGVVDEDDMFTAETQDRVALALLNRRGYKKFLSGRISKERFADNLAKEWASLPTASGKSHYAGDGLNKATRRRKQLMDALEELQGV